MARTERRPLPEWLDINWIEYAFDVIFKDDWQTTIQWNGNIITKTSQFDGYVNVDRGEITPENIQKAWGESYLYELPDEVLLHIEGANEEQRDSIHDGLSWFTTRIVST